MATPDDERIQAMAEEIARLKRSTADLESRVRALEGPPPPTYVPAPEPPPLPVFLRPPAPPAPPPAMPSQAPVEPPALETRLGLNWVNRIAVFTLLLGAAFLFKYGVDNNWIGPGTRVFLGVAAAFIALVLGDRMFHKGHQVYAQGIISLGSALLFLSFGDAAGLYV